MAEKVMWLLTEEQLRYGWVADLREINTVGYYPQRGSSD